MKSYLNHCNGIEKLLLKCLAEWKILIPIIKFYELRKLKCNFIKVLNPFCVRCPLLSELGINLNGMGVCNFELVCEHNQNINHEIRCNFSNFKYLKSESVIELSYNLSLNKFWIKNGDIILKFDFNNLKKTCLLEVGKNCHNSWI